MRRLLAAASVVLLALAGCSSDDDTATPTETVEPTVSIGPDGFQNVLIDASDSYRFLPDEVYVDPGKIRISVSNTALTTVHSLAFKPGGPPESIPLLNPNEVKMLEVIIDNPGDYPFFCTFHEQLGQSGILHVGTAAPPS